jgi:hypothetical protein
METGLLLLLLLIISFLPSKLRLEEGRLPSEEYRSRLWLCLSFRWDFAYLSLLLSRL